MGMNLLGVLGRAYIKFNYLFLKKQNAVIFTSASDPWTAPRGQQVFMLGDSPEV